MEIFYSNGGFRNTPVRDSVSWLVNRGCENIELSSGQVVNEDLLFLKQMYSEGKKFRLHNYFPSLGKSFVMNLASENNEIRNKTQKLIFKALEWSHELESDYYAFHAGFLFDPAPIELGGNLTMHKIEEYEDAKYRFKQQLYPLFERAKTLGVKIAVENNVYDKKNFKCYKDNIPFLAVCEQNINDLLIDGVGLLLDFAHLKVSATSLNQNYHELCRRWLPYVSGFHLSDNDGFVDQNEARTHSVCWLCGCVLLH